MNPNIPSTISFAFQSQLDGQPSSSGKEHKYDYDFWHLANTNISLLKYRPVENIVLSRELEPSIKTLFLQTNNSKFFGCSKNFSDTSPRDLIASNLEKICSDVSGTYTENPFLFFNITTASPSNNTYLRTKDLEYAFGDDSPAFVLHFANSDGSITDKFLLGSAITERNHHNRLKICSFKAGSAETLGPLAFFMPYLIDYSIYISRPRVLSL